jgi:hypothetical protein
LIGLSQQKKLKGGSGPPLVGGFYEVGGWGMNPHYQYTYDINDEIDGTGGAPVELVENPDDIPGTDLLTEPYFRIGDAPNGTHLEYVKLFDPAQVDSASDYLFRATLLAMFIPSKQLGMGGRSLPVNMLAEDRQYEMQSSFDSGRWYDMEKYNSSPKRYWDHGDYKKIAMPYVWKFYDAFIENGELR